jgi:hypothetical protein
MNRHREGNRPPEIDNIWAPRDPHPELTPDNGSAALTS